MKVEPPVKRSLAWSYQLANTLSDKLTYDHGLFNPNPFLVYEMEIR